MKGPRGTLKLIPGLSLPKGGPKRGTIPMNAALDVVEPAKPRAVEAVFDARATQTNEDRPRLLPGDEVGDVRITGLHARGGICEIYLGVIPLLGQEVVVKILNERFAARADVVKRLETEARALAQLQGHPGIVRVISAGHASKVGPYIVMERLNGRTLRELITASGMLSIPKAVSMAIVVATAMHAFHEVDIVHRDLKPENIFIEALEGEVLRVVILDLGCARTPYSAHTTDDSKSMGTARYMSPEQCDRRPVTAASDQYPLGLILYEMILGEHPHEEMCRLDPSATPLREMGWHLLAEVQPLPVPLCPSELWAILARLIHKDQQQRFSSMGEVAKALRGFLDAFLRNASDDVDRDAARALIRAAGPRIVLPGVSAEGESKETVLTVGGTGSKALRPKNPSILFSSRAVTTSLVVSLDEDGVQKRDRFVLGSGATLGRSSAVSDIVLNHESVSRRHVELRVTTGSTYDAGETVAYDVADLGSRNGIEINGTPARVGVLQLYETVRVGDVEVTLYPPGRFEGENFVPVSGRTPTPSPAAAVDAANDLEGHDKSLLMGMPIWAWISTLLFFGLAIVAAAYAFATGAP